MLNVAEAMLDVAEAMLDVAEAMLDVAEAMLSWLRRLCGFSLIIIPLRGPILQAKTCQIFS